MKKAKLMLVGLALFTTVGAALAFKANKMNGSWFCTSVSGAACATSTPGVFIKFSQDDTNGQLSYCSTNSASCTGVADADRIKVVTNPR